MATTGNSSGDAQVVAENGCCGGSKLFKDVPPENKPSREFLYRFDMCMVFKNVRILNDDKKSYAEVDGMPVYEPSAKVKAILKNMGEQYVSAFAYRSYQSDELIVLFGFDLDYLENEARRLEEIMVMGDYVGFPVTDKGVQNEASLCEAIEKIEVDIQTRRDEVYKHAHENKISVQFDRGALERAIEKINADNVSNGKGLTLNTDTIRDSGIINQSCKYHPCDYIYSEFDKDQVYNANGDNEGDNEGEGVAAKEGVFIDFLARETYSENIMLKLLYSYVEQKVFVESSYDALMKSGDLICVFPLHSVPQVVLDTLVNEVCRMGYFFQHDIKHIVGRMSSKYSKHNPSNKIQSVGILKDANGTVKDADSNGDGKYVTNYHRKHALAKTPIEGKYYAICDICKDRSQGSAYHCGHGCNFDVCQQCLDNEVASLKNPIIQYTNQFLTEVFSFFGDFKDRYEAKSRDLLKKGPSTDLSNILESDFSVLSTWNLVKLLVDRLIKDYYGEKIGLYFKFIVTYTSFLVVPSIVAIPFNVVVWHTNNYSSPVLPFYGLLLPLWGVVFLEYWKRTESAVAMRWGMTEYEANEESRPEFNSHPKTVPLPSPVTGISQKVFPKAQKARRIMFSSAIVFLFMCLVVGVVASIYTLRFQLLIQGKGYGSYVASILNSVQILLFNFLYQYVVNHLNDSENHRTDTDYEDAKISKLFVFQFINSYSSFFFLAYVAQYLPSTDLGSRGQCGAYTCMYPLQLNIAIIFGSRLVVQNAMDILLPIILQSWKLSSETKIRKANKEKSCCCCCSCSCCDCAPGEVSKYRNPEDFLSLAELEYMKLKFDPINDVLKLYADTAIQFGYMIMFSTALPTASVCTLINNIVKLPLQYKQISRLYQRPIPVGAQDIGMWYQVFNLIVLIAIVTNAGIIVFTMNCLDLFSDEGRLWVFIGFISVLTTLKFIMEALIPDVPEGVTVQRDRNKLFADAVLKKDLPPVVSKVQNVSHVDMLYDVENRKEKKPMAVLYYHPDCRACTQSGILSKYDEMATSCERKAYFYQVPLRAETLLYDTMHTGNLKNICQEITYELSKCYKKVKPEKKVAQQKQKKAKNAEIELSDVTSSFLSDNEGTKHDDDVGDDGPTRDDDDGGDGGNSNPVEEEKLELDKKRLSRELTMHDYHKINVYKFRGDEYTIDKAFGFATAKKDKKDAMPPLADFGSDEFKKCIGIRVREKPQPPQLSTLQVVSNYAWKMVGALGIVEDLEGDTLESVLTTVPDDDDVKPQKLPEFVKEVKDEKGAVISVVKFTPDEKVPLPNTPTFPTKKEFNEFVEDNFDNFMVDTRTAKQKSRTGIAGYFGYF